MTQPKETAVKLLNLWRGTAGGEKEKSRNVLINHLKKNRMTLQNIDPDLPPVLDPENISSWVENRIQPITAPLENGQPSVNTQSAQLSTAPAPVSPLRRFLPPVIAAALVVALGFGLFRSSNGQVGGPLVGKPAPAFTLQTLNGGTLSLASLKGRPVVLNFWASWCVPCREEAPVLRNLSEKQTANGLAVVGVVFSDKNIKAVNSFVQEYALAYPSLLDPKLNTSIAYGVSGVPETFFIDKAGVVRGYDQGGLTRERLTAGLGKIGVVY